MSCLLCSQLTFNECLSNEQMTQGPSPQARPTRPGQLHPWPPAYHLPKVPLHRPCELSPPVCSGLPGTTLVWTDTTSFHVFPPNSPCCRACLCGGKFGGRTCGQGREQGLVHGWLAGAGPLLQLRGPVLSSVQGMPSETAGLGPSTEAKGG